MRNIQNYNEKMRRSLMDKVFFIDKIPQDIEVIVDFGCADGSLIYFLSNLFPEKTYIGYDNNPNMINEAKKGNDKENIHFSGNWECVVDNTKHKKTAIVFSSVLHEMFDSNDDLRKIFIQDFDYIIVRDMMPSKGIRRQSFHSDVVKVLQRAKPNFLRTFQAKWGSIEDNENLVHYLLKYKYEENWDTEVEENYFSIKYEDWLEKHLPRKYECIYTHRYVLPYIYLTVKEDFDIEIKDNTHIKAIYKRR